MSDTEIRTASTSEVRTWARNRGYTVGTKGHLPNQVIQKFNRSHRKVQAVDNNPSVRDHT